MTDIFSLAVTPTQIFAASGASSLKIFSTTKADFPVAQTLPGAHKLGCHHVVTSKDGRKAASVGFGGETKVWSISGDGTEGLWTEEGTIAGTAHIWPVRSTGMDD